MVKTDGSRAPLLCLIFGPHDDDHHHYDHDVEDVDDVDDVEVEDEDHDHHVVNEYFSFVFSVEVLIRKEVP